MLLPSLRSLSLFPSPFPLPPSIPLPSVTSLASESTSVVASQGRSLVLRRDPLRPHRWLSPPNFTNLCRKIRRGKYQCPKWTSPELRWLLARLLDTNPDTRATVEGILGDPWFQVGLDKNWLLSTTAAASSPSECILLDFFPFSFSASMRERVDRSGRKRGRGQHWSGHARGVGRTGGG
ncbi:hypothetical protein COCNU_03G013330 [Cocos nucifera]|uniref:Uncharacterized protein n=1 Tax=Cocos nucifera TaxID=13894 RepID=A0A8K0I4C3_COCNU|nr:hypothetical protein COCNU_03G013330 [Cocos nucifera]